VATEEQSGQYMLEEALGSPSSPVMSISFMTPPVEQTI
jgi:hypothetical protein